MPDPFLWVGVWLRETTFRGHRDDNIDWNEHDEHDVDQEPAQNLGNFIEWFVLELKLIVCSKIIWKILQKMPSSYTSKTIQNQLVDIVGSHIRSKIINEIQKAKYYSVIADETTDISNKEQLSISFR